MSRSRDDFSALTKRTLSWRVAFKCSNPKCRKLTISPSGEANDKTTSDGVASHITAASAGGPRYDISLSAEERQSITNGIWLCSNCSILIDKEPSEFSVSLLNDWKLGAEFEMREEFLKRPVLTDTSPLVKTEMAWISSSRWNYGANEFNDPNKIKHWLDISWTFRLNWNFNLIIFNDTQSLIKGIELEGKNKNVKIDSLPIQKTALNSLGLLETGISFEKFFDGTGFEADEIMKNHVPSELIDAPIILKYQNLSGNTFSINIPFVK
jgi:hypothetical protein